MTLSWPGPEHVAVVQNRWDQVPADGRRPSVSVIVCHYDQARDLDRLLAGIALQRGAVDIGEVIVVDDGSPIPPTPPAMVGRIPIKLLRQADRGVRPAAARNLGVRHSRGEILVFLDADTTPGPDAIARLAALPSVSPDAITVGRRRHVDLDGWSAEETAAWLSGSATAPDRLEDPAWLREGYDRTRDLIEVDDRSYQYVIGAVMALSHRFFDILGGFDESIDTYGGEDWTLAYWAYVQGAVLAHCADAEVFHNGGDWAARNDHQGIKNEERLVLMGAIPGPDDAVIGRFAPALVTIQALGWERDVALAVVSDLLRAGGSSVRVAIVDAPSGLAALVVNDTRVRIGNHGETTTARALVRIEVLAPVLVGGGGLHALTRLVAPGGPGRVDLVDGDETVAIVTSTRAEARARRWAHQLSGFTAALRTLFGVETRPLPSVVQRVTGSVDLRTWFER